MSEGNHKGFLLIAFVAVLLSFGLALLYLGEVKSLKSQAINRGYALYHPTNGEFVWRCDFEEEGSK